MKNRNISLITLAILISFVGIIKISAITYTGTSESDYEGKPFYYKYGNNGGIPTLEEQDKIYTVDEWKDAINNGNLYTKPDGTKVGDGQYPVTDKDKNKELTALKACSETGSDYCVRVSTARIFKIGTENGSGVQVFCLDAITAFKVGQNVTYSSSSSPSSNTDKNMGMACGLIDAYKDSSIRKNMVFDSNNQLDLRSIDASVIYSIQKKIWKHQYSNCNYKDESKRTFEEDIKQSERGTITFSPMQGDMEFSYNNNLKSYVSSPIKISTKNVKGNILLSVNISGAYLATSKDATSKNSISSIGKEGGTIYIIVPASKMVFDTSKIELNYTSEVKTKEKTVLESEFTYYASKGSQSVGIPKLTKTITDIYSKKEGKIVYSKKNLMNEITVCKKFDGTSQGNIKFTLLSGLNSSKVLEEKTSVDNCATFSVENGFKLYYIKITHDNFKNYTFGSKCEAKYSDTSNNSVNCTVTHDNNKSEYIQVFLDQNKGKKLSLTVTNKESPKLVVNKVNTSGEFVDGATFALFDSDNKRIEEIKTSSGKAEFHFKTEGTYRLYEKVSDSTLYSSLPEDIICTGCQANDVSALESDKAGYNGYFEIKLSSNTNLEITVTNKKGCIQRFEEYAINGNPSMEARISLFQEYHEKFNNLLDRGIRDGNTACTYKACELSASADCLVGNTSVDAFNSENLSCFTDYLSDGSENVGLCATTFNFNLFDRESIVPPNSTFYAKVGQSIIKTMSERIASGILTKKCYIFKTSAFDLNNNANASYDSIIKNSSNSSINPVRFLYNKSGITNVNRIKDNYLLKHINTEKNLDGRWYLSGTKYSDLILLNDNMYTFNSGYEYGFEPIILEIASGKKIKTGRINYIVDGYGIISNPSTLVLKDNLIFEYDFSINAKFYHTRDEKFNILKSANSVTGSGTCKYELEPELYKVQCVIKDNKYYDKNGNEVDEATYKERCGDPSYKKSNPLNLEFRIIDTTVPFPGISGGGRETGSNWRGNVEEYIQNAINSYGYDGDGKYHTPKYVIRLTPSDIKEIRAYNKITTYDDYNTTCTGKVGEDESCKYKSSFVNGIWENGGNGTISLNKKTFQIKNTLKIK